MASALAASGLTKRYGRLTAVDGVSLSLETGQIVGFLGPNGAGKTTTLRMLTGVLRPTSGVVTIMGHDLERAPNEARRALGYMPEGVPLYPEMRVGEYLRFRAELKGLGGAAAKEAVRRVVAAVGLEAEEGRLVGQLSKGTRQRVGLADALVASPPVIVLDEPMAGLDPNQMEAIRTLLTGLGERHTILFSTHQLADVEALCQRVVLIANGKVVLDGTLDDVRRRAAPSAVRLVVRGDAAAVRAAAEAMVGASRVSCEVDGDLVTVVAELAEGVEAAGAAEELGHAVAQAGGRVREQTLVGGTLEAVFRDATIAGAARSKREEESS